MKDINELFDVLDSWRHLPAYRLEPRVDVFFSMYLHDIVKAQCGLDSEGVIPEFPIKQANSNRSDKVDFFIKVKGQYKVILVELKTDENSRRERQDDYLKRAQKRGLKVLLQDLSLIYRATKSKPKYRHLMETLQELNLFTDGGGEHFVENRDGEIDLLYIQPNNSDGESNVVSFDDVAKSIRRHHADAMSKRFALSLETWSKEKPGRIRK